MSQYTDIKTTSQLTGISVISLRRGAKTGRFKAIRIGKALRGKLMFDIQQLSQQLADEAYGVIKEKECE